MTTSSWRRPTLAGAREFEVAVVGDGASSSGRMGPGEVFPGATSSTTMRPSTRPGVVASDRCAGAWRRPGAGRHPGARPATPIAAIGASGFARVDFLMHGGRIFLSEINTIPGFTPISLFPILCRQGGYAFGGICAHIVELAIGAPRRPNRRLDRADAPVNRTWPGSVSGNARGRPCGARSSPHAALIRRASAGPVAGRVLAGLVLVTSAARALRHDRLAGLPTP